MHCSCGPAVLRAVQPTGMAAEKGLPRPCACIVTTVTTYEKSECCLVPGNRQHALYLLQHMFDKTWLRERPAVGSWRTKGNCQRSDLCKRVACSSYVVASSLLPLACPLTSFPLPVGHADESVPHPKQMPSLQHGGTRWRPAREEVRRTIKLHCPRLPLTATLASNLQHAHVNGIPRLWAANLVLHREPHVSQSLAHLLLGR